MAGGGKKGKSCILTVGATGTGKTSTINLFTGANEEVGETVHSETGETKTVKDQKHANGVPWVDNPGWADTEGKSDNLLFKDLLRHLHENNIQSVAAVVWCVSPNERMDMMLQNQAKLIDMLTKDLDKGKIWANVIILSKGTLRETAKEDCIGAEMAARQICASASPRSLGYKFAEEIDLVELSSEVRKRRRLLTEPEALEQLEQEMAKLPEPVQVVFSNKKCKGCGQTGDPRLMDDLCHREMVMGHQGNLGLKKKPSKLRIGVASATSAVGVIGLGIVSVLVPGGHLLLYGVPVLMLPGSGMALHRVLSKGVHKYKKCGCNIEASGCTQKCDGCGEEWGTGNPCVMITAPDPGLLQSLEREGKDYKFHKKDHDLEDIVSAGN